MDKLSELKAKLSIIDEQATKAKDRLIKDYCFDSAKYKVGDVISSRSCTIKITTLKWSSGDRWGGCYDPEVVYRGEVLTKQLKPRKDGSMANIYQSMII